MVTTRAVLRSQAFGLVATGLAAGQGLAIVAAGGLAEVISADLVIAGAGAIATVLAAALTLTGQTHSGRHRNRHH